MNDHATTTPAAETARTISPKQHSSCTQRSSQIIVSSDQTVQVPWVEKYRPAKLEDLVAHEDIVSILTRLIDSDNLPHLLLYGPPGTGKVIYILIDYMLSVQMNDLYSSMLKK